MKRFIVEYYNFKLAKIKHDPSRWIEKPDRIKKINKLYSWISHGIITEDTFLNSASDI